MTLIDPAAVKKPRRDTAIKVISTQKGHLPPLHSTVADRQRGPQENFIAYLRSIPKGGAIPFPRAKDDSRPNEFR
jgi:hypothetical protein